MSIHSSVTLWALIVFFALIALANVASIGKERKPITPELAVVSVILSALWIFGLAMVLVSK